MLALTHFAEGESPFLDKLSFVTPEPRSELSTGFIASRYIPIMSVLAPKWPRDALNDQNLVVAYLNKVAPDIAPILSEVARCESGYQQKWNYMNKEGDPNSKWSAYGYFQIIKGTAQIDPILDRMKPIDNIELAVKIYRKSGITPWKLSEDCHKQS